MEPVTYRIYGVLSGSNPTLSATPEVNDSQCFVGTCRRLDDLTKILTMPILYIPQLRSSSGRNGTAASLNLLSARY
jgi:hypothetical protein